MKNIEVRYHNYDILIIGAGGAGLASAILSCECGMSVAVLSKVDPIQSHTIAAQGGINAALGNIEQDDWRWHVYDTVKAGDWLADQDAVEILCKNAKDAISFLDKIGVQFNRTSNGAIDQKIYGGQSTHYGTGKLAYRACYSADRTGHSIMTQLVDVARAKNITFFDYNFAIDLMMHYDECYGAVTLDNASGHLNVIYANNTIIATGGYSQIYQTSTSSSICTGDGNALAFRAGIGLQDMEFIQFHPTAISKIGVLITEAARSAGGKLVNKDCIRFMSKYAPKFLELASRDVVARAIATEIASGAGCGNAQDHVLLDLTHLTRQEIVDNLPNIFENCQTFLKLDPSKQPIPVAPAAHYTMGGIPTDKFCRVIRFDVRDNIIKSLYAIGETASISVHGAGRLGCNSLLDLIVFAKITTDHIKQNKHNKISITKAYKGHETIIAHFKQIFTGKENCNLETILADVKSIMQKYVGVFRNHDNLSLALARLSELNHKFANVKIADQSLLWNEQLQRYFELSNMLICAQSTTASALSRTESRGAHFRSDYQQRDDKNFLYHTIYNPQDHKARTTRPVRPGSHDMYFPPESRNY